MSLAKAISRILEKPLPGLNAQQEQAALLFLKGYTMREIGIKLNVSHTTAGIRILAAANALGLKKSTELPLFVLDRIRTIVKEHE